MTKTRGSSTKAGVESNTIAERAPVEGRPTCYIIRARFQPCLRQHYYAIRDLILTRSEEFTSDWQRVSEHACIMLLIIADVTHEISETSKNETLGKFRYWKAFNPLSGGETVQQLEMALWGYLSEDPSLSMEQLAWLRKVFAHSIFPVSSPLQISETTRVLGGADKPIISSATGEWVIGDKRTKEYIRQIFRHVHPSDGGYNACWTFPLLDLTDTKDVDVVMDCLRRNNDKLVYNEEIPNILLGEFRQESVLGPKNLQLCAKEDEAHHLNCDMTLGPYGASIFDKLCRRNERFDLSNYFFCSKADDKVGPKKIEESEKKLVGARLETLISLSVSHSTHSFFLKNRKSSVGIAEIDPEDWDFSETIKDAISKNLAKTNNNLETLKKKNESRWGRAFDVGKFDKMVSSYSINCTVIEDFGIVRNFITNISKHDINPFAHATEDSWSGALENGIHSALGLHDKGISPKLPQGRSEIKLLHLLAAAIDSEAFKKNQAVEQSGDIVRAFATVLKGLLESDDVNILISNIKDTEKTSATDIFIRVFGYT